MTANYMTANSLK